LAHSQKKIVEANQLLLEIGCEELPPLFLDTLYHQGANFLANYLQPRGVDVEKSGVYLTPRRIVYFLQGIALNFEVLEQEVQGPPWHIAFDEKGKPTPAAKGFAKKLFRPLKDLYPKEMPKGKYLCGRVRWEGDLRSLLPSLLPDFILSLANHYPKRMRWGEEEISFLRPIHWILCLLDDYPLRFAVGSVKSGVKTRGHRFASSGWMTIRNPQDYFAKMVKANVALASPQTPTESLKFEYEYLSEGEAQFPEKFNVLPSEVVKTVIQTQMHCVPEFREDGTLTNRFLFTADGPKSASDMETIRRGYEKLAVARLTDALYFYEKDLKKPLVERVDDLKGILFLEGFGSLYEKIQRLKGLAPVVNSHLKNPADPEGIERSALLCRADQATRMVREITDLEGKMGKIYALKSGESPEVAQAVYESYLPKGAQDEVPKTLPGIVLSLADKIDNLLCYFSTEMRPTGTSDPLGFRRNALGILRILDENKLDFPLRRCMENCAIKAQIGKDKISEIRDFFHQRFENYIREFAPFHGREYEFGNHPEDVYSGALLPEHFEHDVVQAALAYSFENPYSAILLSIFLQVLKNRFLEGYRSRFGSLVRVGVRIHNIYLQGLSFGVKPELNLAIDTEPGVHQIYGIYQSLSKGLQEFQNAPLSLNAYYHFYERYFTSVVFQTLDNFFDRVLVMHSEAGIRANRIALLGLIDRCFQVFGDLTKIVIEKYE